MEKSRDKIELSTFMIGNALCGIDILKIQEINRNFDITEVPQAEAYVKGILNLRGKIVTIIDMGKKLELSPITNCDKTRNIVVDSGSEDIGFMVDAVCDVVIADHASLEPPPSNMNGIKSKYFKSVLKTDNNLIGVLDIDEILAI